MDTRKNNEQIFLKEFILLKLSVSSMGTYDKCPKKYHYRYIEKPEVQAVKWGFTEFGSCAHLILELFHKAILKRHIPKDKYPALMKWAFNKSLKKFDYDLLNELVWTPNGDRKGIAYLKDIMQEYLEKLKEEGMPNVVGVEVPYEFSANEGVKIRGFIDRIDKVDEGVYHVIDYKTSKNERYLDEVQLLVYANAIHRKYPDCEKVIGSYMMLKHGFKEKKWTFDGLDIERCDKLIDNKASLIINEKDWVKKPTMLCTWCDYKNICQDSWTD